MGGVRRQVLGSELGMTRLKAEGRIVQTYSLFRGLQWGEFEGEA